ncbi:MAG: TonB-dependent receptor [Calditrichaeota bacterium]|nr:MAG: TonB-dependent receptor [Calditrichota bacterium]MBL1206522.1 TonB-dependent receptor [Calditrichota bacterium]NOG46349.1 TonB-dependent receptor [Calditrichota bacterium]
MIPRFKQIVLIFLFLFATNIYPENNNKKNDHVIHGYIIDAESKHPISYANVLLFSSETKKQTSGIATNDDGYFELNGIGPGVYFMEIHFIGYKIKQVEDIEITEENDLFDMGEIIIQPDLLSTDNIEVLGQRSPITYQIDKKIINVDEQITATSGTAVEILENVPSVTVDIEGNVSLRGSSNFTVLIDGRPTILEANDILQQISAASIDNIEIITNPSAKFNPEGTTGIINLVMKKNKQLGFHGLVEGNGGYRNRYGGQAILNYKSGKYQLTMDAGYGQRARYGDEREENITTQENVSSFRNSEGTSDREGDRFRVRGELGIQLSPADFLSFGGNFQDRERRRIANINFSEWTDLAPEKINTASNTFRSRGGDEYSVYASYDHKFNESGHLIRAEAQYESGDSKESTNTELLDNNFAIVNGIKTTEDGPDEEFQAKLDYTLPLNKDTKFEAGYQNELDLSDELTGYSTYNPTSGRYELHDEFSNHVKSQRNEHALYSLFASKIGQLGYQFGFRAEYTDRKIELVETTNTFTLNRWDYFPSIHSSYKFANGHQVMASYTRRIDRPRGWYLEPFETWFDAFNVRVGNPDIIPEYIDSYEAGYQAALGKTVLSTEFYYRINHNKIERLRSVYDETVTLHTTENVGTDYSSGTELMVNFDPVKDWNVNLLGNLYNYRIEGAIFEEAFSRESFNWNVRFNNRFKLWESAQLQLNMNYNSASVSSQSEREGFFYTHLALKQEFFNKTLSATLQIRDMFGTANYEHTSKGTDFYTYRLYEREFPEITLNVRYFINRQQNKKDRNRGGGDGEDFNGGEEF